MEKIAQASSSRMDTVRQREQLAQLKRNLRSAKERIQTMKQSADRVDREKDSVQEELREANRKLLVLREERPQLRTTRSGVSDDEARKLREQLANAKQTLARREEELQRMSSSAAMTRGAPQAEELERLRLENRRLMEELASFDLEFFEEVEDLKYRYHESQAEVKKLRAQLEA